MLEGIGWLMRYNYLDKSKIMPIKELNTLVFIIFTIIELFDCPTIKVLVHYFHRISFNLIVNCIPIRVKHYYELKPIHFMIDEFIIIVLEVDLFEDVVLEHFKQLVIIKLTN